ncbi:hypothetical protein A3D71_01150 [Candidatus Kaiserbacteria bacterium RIFCSPHIGHO2_02_FULL_55_20]|uniref:Uncharacterized protein n=1 Tax=Candidatus Kaiserbacteria bacterium RIFCSPHIGHO2_02_FULL_55_20 TaxID=1798497 RepID=A0A1F6DYN6_9BACT|nr:MAG: hypothetical protein A3D71_01150 [Candidatus Kaiserbacteria bacterium RIFCSPHIGHO2_02_FULL_55_20]
MGEDIPDSVAQRKALERQVRDYVDERGIAPDSWNNIYGGVGILLRRQEAWAQIEPIPTYEQYVREYSPDPSGDIVMKISNKELVAQYDEVVRKINLEIGTGVKSEVQVSNIRALIDEARKIIRGDIDLR